jgi:hypothetical protein
MERGGVYGYKRVQRDPLLQTLIPYFGMGRYLASLYKVKKFVFV